jgi:quercetin dioxygenase-like cupin family protein
LQRSPFTRSIDAPVIELRELEGRALPISAEIRELLWGDEAVLIQVDAPAGYDAEPHVHDHESLIYLVSGRVRATVGDETFQLGPGDAMLHPQGVMHHVEALAETRWIEIKSPPRATWPTGTTPTSR